MVRAAQSRDALVGLVAQALETVPEVAAAYVYGSVARGTATSLSDVDVAVLLVDVVASERRARLIRSLTTLLERSCPGRRFEVRLFDELPIAIRGRIVSEGVLVVDRNHEFRVNVEVRTRMDYFDFLVFERTGTRAGLKGLREVFESG